MSQGTTEVPQPLWGEIQSIQRMLASSHQIDNAGEEALLAVIDDLAVGQLAAGDVERRYSSIRRNRRRRDARRCSLGRQDAGYYDTTGRVPSAPRLDEAKRRPRRHAAHSGEDHSILRIDCKRLIARVASEIAEPERSIFVSVAADLPATEVSALHGLTVGAMKTRLSRARSRLRATALGRAAAKALN